MKVRRMLQAVLRQDLVQVFLVLSFLIGVLFWKVFLLDHALVPADIVFTDPAWYDIAPLEYHDPQNPLFVDQAFSLLPLHYSAAQTMQTEGRIPLWSPYLFAGQPLVADMQSALFYPPNLLLFWLSPATVAGIRAIFKLLFAGLFTFLLCRKLRVSKSGAILAAVNTMLSGPMIVWLGWPISSVLVCLPFLMWAGEGLLSGKRSVLWGALLAAGTALAIFGGHPETTFHVAVVLAIYFLARLFLGQSFRGQRRRLLAGLLLAAVLGVMLASVQWMPFADFLPASSTMAKGGRTWVSSTDSLLDPPGWKTQLVTAVTLWFPDFFGSPTTRYRWPFPSDDLRTQWYQNYNEQTAYFGLVPLALAAGGVFSRRRKQWVTIVAALALLCLAVAWRLPGLDVVNRLPLFSIVDNSRLRILFAFLGSLVAGFAFDEMKQYVLSRGQESRRVGHVAILVLASALCVLAAMVLTKFLIFPLAAKLGLNRPPGLLNFLWRFPFGELKTLIPAIAAIAAAGVVALCRRGSWRRWFDWAFIAIVTVELLVLAWGYNPTIKADAVFPATALTDLLSRETEPFRIMGVDAFQSNSGAVYGIEHVEGYDLPVFRRFSDLYYAQGGTGFDYFQHWSPDWPLTDWMNVKYIVTSQELPTPKFTLLSVLTGTHVYRNETVLPRAYMVYQMHIIRDDRAALARLTDGTFDFRERVILSEELPEMAQLPGTPGESVVQFLSYGSDRVTLRVSTRPAGILVVSDVYASGWKVRVDGVEADIVRANYAFRAVFVPEGEHVITFDYQPASFQIGRLLSIMGLVTWVLGALWSVVRKC